MREIDPKLAWNHPKNEKYFKVALDLFINTDFRTADLVDANGFGLSHYAANCHVMAGNSAVKVEDLPHGSANTFLIGGVHSNFQPWGHPVNWRDPTKGINQSPHGFGGPPNSGGCYFIMADGPVRFVSERIDPEVLRALSGLPGGATVDANVLGPKR